MLWPDPRFKTLMQPSEQGKSKPFPVGNKGMSVEQAIRAMTIDAAWQLRMEDKIGSLEVGKYADLVVLEKNPFDVDPLDIEEIDVLMTMMDGKFTYKAGETTSQIDLGSDEALIASAAFAHRFYCGGPHSGF